MSVSQPARFGEDWSDERVAGYLNRQAPAGTDADFHALHTAYKHMRAEDFARFLNVFKSAGRRVDARNPQGNSLLDLVAAHPASAAFAHLLQREHTLVSHCVGTMP